jgi:transcription antitermination factor NusG
MSGDNNLKWFAFYTAPRAEKKIADRLAKLNIEHYLPLLKTLRQWSDRKKMVIEPLFKSYIFIRLPEQDIRNILPVEGIIKVINFGGIPQSIPEEQLSYLKLLLENPDAIEIHNTISIGDKVKVTQGPLTGVEGVLLKNAEKNFIVNIDIVGHSVSVYINPVFLRKI